MFYDVVEEGLRRDKFGSNFIQNCIFGWPVIDGESIYLSACRYIRMEMGTKSGTALGLLLLRLSIIISITPTRKVMVIYAIKLYDL